MVVPFLLELEGQEYPTRNSAKEEVVTGKTMVQNKELVAVVEQLMKVEMVELHQMEMEVLEQLQVLTEHQLQERRWWRWWKRPWR